MSRGGGKSKYLFVTLITALIFFNIHLFSQNVIEGKLTVNTLSDDARPEGNRMVKNESLLNLFQQYGVTMFEQTFPFAKTPSLHAVYTIEFTGNHQEFKNELEQTYSNLIDGIWEEYETISCYEPVDKLWEEGKLWHLYKIQADSAWEYTHSSDSIDICIIDATNIICDHPDLVTKFDPVVDIYTGDSLFASLIENEDTPPLFKHPTEVSTFAAAETTEIGNTPNGRLAASGFNSSLMYTTVSDQIAKAVYASTVAKAEVINISSYSVPCHDSVDEYPGYIYEALNEIFNNGTVLIASAGNGEGTRCGSRPFAIFNGYVDERIIQVSGTDSSDYFTVINGEGNPITFSHFSAVDLCAPGYNMYGPEMTLIIDSLGDTVPNPYPYFHNFSGTSYAAPITAGVAALVKSINPCLTPSDVQTILKSTTDPIIDANLYPGEVGTGRLNAYQAVKLAYESYSFKNYTIPSGQNIIWNDVHFIDTLYIEPDGELTINDNCFFNVSGIVRIDTNAKLTVNNAKLTTTCGNMWNGIEVWGNKNSSQYPYYSGDYAQGRLYLNNATVENAEEAVRLWKPGDYQSTGGICIATNSIFKNNRRSSEYMSYHNFYPPTGASDNNFSKYDNCDFIFDDNYLNTVSFNGFVTLWNVEGVEFKGCTFINERDSIYYNNELVDDSLIGYGISSIDANFIVTSGCNSQVTPCPEYDIDSSRFVRLQYGIKAYSAVTQNTIAVDNTVFNDNITGLYTNGLRSARIIHNMFNVNAVDTSANNGIIGGVYFDNYSSGFVFEENILMSDQGLIGGGWEGRRIKSIGICVNNSGGDNNYIYNNEFENLYVGVLAQNWNRGRFDGNTGLEIKCNEFYNIEYDVAVTADSLHDPSSVMSGIKKMQGSDGPNITDPAGNIFSDNLSPDDGWDIHTETYNKFIQYWYHVNQNGFDLVPDSVTPFLVSVSPNTNVVDPFTKISACPSQLGGDGGSGVLLNMISENEQKADSVTNLLTTLVDGGDTQGTAYEVETAWPDETMEVRQNLLDKSPYLSDTVMVTTVQQEEVLPPAIVTEILVANPQSAKSDIVLDKVYDREDLTGNQIDQIEANAMVTGARESLEIRKANYLGVRDYATHRLCAKYKTDTTIVNPQDSIIALLVNQDFKEAKYMLAFEYLAKGDLQKAQDTLESIPNHISLSAFDQNEQDQYEDYMDILVNLKQNDKNIFQLTSAQKSGLYNIINNSRGRAGAWASNILLFADTLNYTEKYILPADGQKQGRVQRLRHQDAYPENKLRIYPNPAHEYVIVEYQLKEGVDRATINIIDNNGFIRQTIVPDTNGDFAVIDTRNMENGSYICIVSANGQRVGVSKFVVIR